MSQWVSKPFCSPSAWRRSHHLQRAQPPQALLTSTLIRIICTVSRGSECLRRAGSAAAGRPGAQQAGAAAAAAAAAAGLEAALESEVLVDKPDVKWDDVVGLGRAKQALQEAVVLPTIRSDLFRVPPSHPDVCPDGCLDGCPDVCVHVNPTKTRFY